MYPELSNGITILKSKILSLTETVETMDEKQDLELKEKDRIIKELTDEIARLKN